MERVYKMMEKKMFDFKTESVEKSTYYYLRNGILHKKITTDFAMELSESETVNAKKELTDKPWDKQGILENLWFFFEKTVGKKVYKNGISLAKERSEKMTRNAQGLNNGYKN